ncbi:putative Dna excision/repair protein SNF2 [Leptomonas seymouri]|uniref:Putative Dna excision/repair protein SNF2 n=1 Tax=Leptomonas seymouri TaxID=5684 RepID=A0A0N1HYE0_LEPSE|nr:putative Dna excision/repair protein SNF2 [Leptomonas seymouri]|eukprot:KPI87838.1 putative Dna excision/repair protein SNF2 [Leptomonas seymouri]
MEHDDVLDDLLSWTGGSTLCGTKGPPPRRPSLQESCVNTAPCPADVTTLAGAAQPRKTEDGRGLLERAASCGEGDRIVAPENAIQLPDSVQSRLLPHQREGVQWLYARHCKSRACLLADEMGLGKTVQVAVFLGELYRRKLIKTSVLIVPSTLVPMWEAALSDWGGGEMHRLIEVIHNEPRKRRQARWRKLKYGLPCVFLTTYGVLRQDAADMSAALVDYVVLDEAHLIKDPSTCAFKSALALSARHKIALSGTPLMNSFDDMWSVFRFLDVSIMSVSRADFNAVSTTLLRGNERDASCGQREAAAAELRKLQAAIRPFMLRREKKGLANVVSSTKQDVIVWVRMTDVQQQQYEAFLESKGATAASASPSGATSNDAGTNPLLLLTMLSLTCNHPWLNLVDAAFDAAVAQPFTAPLPEMGDIFAGAKLWVALQLLVRCTRQGRKSLVFSRSKRLLRLLSCLLRDWRVPHVQVDGDTSSEHRFAEVQRFNDSPDVWVCLLTTQVGGVGLTFTATSAVVLLDPSWNPSADAQAVDRVHRIGQTRDVVVFRLATCGTVEEKIYRNQIFKRMAALQSMSVDAAGDSAELSCEAGVGEAEPTAPPAPTEQQRPSPSPPPPPPPHEQTPTELYRYFTRLQLRSMFVMDDVDRSSTAEQLEVLHPHRVDDDLRRDLTRIDGVCNVSDNSCVLTESVDPSGTAELDLLPSSASASQKEKVRGVEEPVSVCVSPRTRCRSGSLPTLLSSATAEGHPLCSAAPLAPPSMQRQRVEEAALDAFPKDGGSSCIKDDVRDACNNVETVLAGTCGVSRWASGGHTPVHLLGHRSSPAPQPSPAEGYAPDPCSSALAVSGGGAQQTQTPPFCLLEGLTAAAVADGGVRVPLSPDEGSASFPVGWDELEVEATGFASAPTMGHDGASGETTSFDLHSPPSSMPANAKSCTLAAVTLPDHLHRLPQEAEAKGAREGEEEVSVGSSEFASCRSSCEVR